MYLKNWVTTSQKHAIDPQQQKRENKSIMSNKIIKPQKGEKKEIKKKYKISGKTRPKMTISTYLSIITLTWHGLNALIKKHRVGDQIFRKAYNMLSIRDPQ